MRKAILITLSVILSSISSFACLNGETHVLKDGTVISMDEFGRIVPHGHQFFSINYDETLSKLDSLYHKTKNLDYLSDYGIVLILKKEYDEAKEIYLKIEQIKPKRYSTASNLGTIYELMGDNVNAIIWIKKAISINPKSHYHSEWIHVNILEAKIKGDAYINSDFLIKTNFGNKSNPESALTKKKLHQLRDALFYQLNERVSFIKPKDKIIASLMFDLGNIAFLTDAKQEAVVIYNKAKEYGFSDLIIEERIKHAKAEKEKKAIVSNMEEKSNIGIWLLTGVAVFMGVSFAAYKRRMRSISKSAN